jgi:hypothetical protein
MTEAAFLFLLVAVIIAIVWAKSETKKGRS